MAHGEDMTHIAWQLAKVLCRNRTYNYHNTGRMLEQRSCGLYQGKGFDCHPWLHYSESRDAVFCQLNICMPLRQLRQSSASNELLVCSNYKFTIMILTDEAWSQDSDTVLVLFCNFLNMHLFPEALCWKY